MSENPYSGQPFADGGSAFPHDNQELGDKHRIAQPGMTLRDYFAAAALTTFSNNSPFAVSGEEHFARRAYEIADAMLVERERNGE